jgi:hypothetical protein
MLLHYILHGEFGRCAAVIGNPDLKKFRQPKHREPPIINGTGLGLGPSSTIMTDAAQAV